MLANKLKIDYIVENENINQFLVCKGHLFRILMVYVVTSYEKSDISNVYFSETMN